MSFQYDPSGVSMLGLKEPSKPIHVGNSKKICLHPNEKEDPTQYQSFLQVANALAMEMKFFPDSYSKALNMVEGKTYENLDCTPEASVWDMITGQGLHAENASVVDDINNNFNWDDIKSVGGTESYDKILNSGELYGLSDEQAFDLMCSMLDAKERVFGAYEKIFGSADDLGNEADVIGKINKFLNDNNSIDPHNMGLISLFFGLQGRFMDALSKFSGNSAFMEKVQNYIDNSGLSDAQKNAANVLKDEWMNDMRRWDQVSGTSVNCHPEAFELLFDKANQTMGLIQSQKNAVMEAYSASNGDLTLFGDKLAAITIPLPLTSSQIAAIKNAFNSAEKDFPEIFQKHLRAIGGLSADQISQAVEAYAGSVGNSTFDPAVFSGLLNSITPPLTADQITAIQAALVGAEDDFRTNFDPSFDLAKGDSWYDYFHYEMAFIGNKNAVKTLTADMYNSYLDRKYKTDETDYQDKKDDRIQEEMSLMRIEAKHRSEAKARLNALLKRKSSSIAAKSAKSSASRSRVSSSRRAPAVAPRASRPVVSAPVMGHAQSAAMAAGFAARNAHAAAIAAGASKRNVSVKARSTSVSSEPQASSVQAKKHAKNENKVI
jgi:hypothetical protein